MVKKEYKRLGRDKFISTILPGTAIIVIYILPHLLLITADISWSTIPWKYLLPGIVGLLIVSVWFKNRTSQGRMGGYYRKAGSRLLLFLIILVIFTYIIPVIPQNDLMEIKLFHFSFFIFTSIIALFYLIIHHSSGGDVGFNKDDIVGYVSPLMIPLFTFLAHFEYADMMWISILDGSMFKVYLLMAVAVIFCILSTLNSYRILKEEDK